MPTLTVLVGLPGSGKSTSIPEDFNGFVYSTDRYIEAEAASEGKTYSECFKDCIKDATSAMDNSLKFSIEQRKDVIWDQTNVSDKKRRGIISRFPSSYHKICVCRVPPRDDAEWAELMKRVASREGKVIPHHIIYSMADTYVCPSLEEGFDEVRLFDIYGNQI